MRPPVVTQVAIRPAKFLADLGRHLGPSDRNTPLPGALALPTATPAIAATYAGAKSGLEPDTSTASALR